MLHDIVYNAQQMVLDYVLKDGREVSGETLGLDPRALHRGWVTSGALVVASNHDSSLQYYGGFEYVEKSARTVVGNYVIYWRDEDERVDGAISCAEEVFEQENTVSG